MLSFSSFVFSWRMRLSKIKKHKLLLFLVVILIITVGVMGPTVYQESWLDPFSTMKLPNRDLHPHAITQVGILNSNDPFHPHYFADEGKIQLLMRSLERATPLSVDQNLSELTNQEVQFFTLHRAPSKYHTAEDYALQYYPNQKIVRFGDQSFRINESCINAFNQIIAGMTSGWWKS